MKLNQTSGCPYSYAGSAVLAPPLADPDVSSVSRRVGMFTRESILDMGARLMWFMWHNPNAVDANNMIVRAMAPLLIAFGAMFGSNDSRPRISELEFRLLCWEIFDSPDLPSMASAEAQNVLQKLVEQRRVLPVASRLARLTDDDLRVVWREHRIGQLVQLQFAPFVYVPSDFVRTFLVFEELVAEANRRSPQRFRTLSETFFGIPTESVLRSFASVVAVAMTADPKGAECPGLFDVPDSTDGFLGVQPRELRVLARRFGTKTSEFPALGELLSDHHDFAFKYAPAARRLTTHPFIERDDAPVPGFFVSVPSAWHLRAALSSILLDEFVAFLSGNGLGGPDAYSMRGEAFGRYLRKALAFRGEFIDCDNGVEGEAGKRPDFLWVGKRFGILIEAKVRLTPNTDPLGTDPTSVFEAWRRSEEAIDQAQEFLSRRCDELIAQPLPQKWVVVLVTLQSLAAESTAFRSAAKRWRWLDGTDLAALGVMSPAQLEGFALAGDADALAEYVAKAWSDLDVNSLQRTEEGPREEETAVSPHISEGWPRLLPDVPSPWSR